MQLVYCSLELIQTQEDTLAPFSRILSHLCPTSFFSLVPASPEREPLFFTWIPGQKREQESSQSPIASKVSSSCPPPFGRLNHVTFLVGATSQVSRAKPFHLQAHPADFGLSHKQRTYDPSKNNFRSLTSLSMEAFRGTLKLHLFRTHLTAPDIYLSLLYFVNK